MKVFLFSVAAFLTAALLSYTLKTEIKVPSRLQEETKSCYLTDVRELSKVEGATKNFGALHPEPLQFEYKDQKGKIVTYKTPDGITASGYEIKNKVKTDNYLLVIHEWYGLNDYIKQEADLLSNDLENINILALDLYDGKVATTSDSAMKLVSGVNSQRLENIIKGALDYAGNSSKIYTVGWCFGGMWSLQASILAGSKGAGCVMYYGRPETNVEKLKQLHADVIGFFGNLDKSITPEKVTEFKDNMKEAGKTLTVNQYDAGHGFANPSNPVFNKEARDDAHQKTIQFLKERIK